MPKTSQERFKSMTTPTGRAWHGTSTVGNGDPCPVDGHGKMYVLPSGRQWCPDQSHDKERVKKNG